MEQEDAAGAALSQDLFQGQTSSTWNTRGEFSPEFMDGEMEPTEMESPPRLAQEFCRADPGEPGFRRATGAGL